MVILELECQFPQINPYAHCPKLPLPIIRTLESSNQPSEGWLMDMESEPRNILTKSVIHYHLHPPEIVSVLLKLIFINNHYSSGKSWHTASLTSLISMDYKKRKGYKAQGSLYLIIWAGKVLRAEEQFLFNMLTPFTSRTWFWGSLMKTSEFKDPQ